MNIMENFGQKIFLPASLMISSTRCMVRLRRGSVRRCDLSPLVPLSDVLLERKYASDYAEAYHDQTEPTEDPAG